MVKILKGRDTDLGRDLAMKVLLDKHIDNPEVIQRFIEEAQIGCLEVQQRRWVAQR